MKKAFLLLALIAANVAKAVTLYDYMADDC